MSADTNANDNDGRNRAVVFKCLELIKQNARAVVQEPDDSGLMKMYAETIKVSLLTNTFCAYSISPLSSLTQ
jgi:hypothetical protein